MKVRFKLKKIDYVVIIWIFFSGLFFLKRSLLDYPEKNYYDYTSSFFDIFGFTYHLLPIFLMLVTYNYSSMTNFEYITFRLKERKKVYLYNIKNILKLSFKFTMMVIIIQVLQGAFVLEGKNNWSEYFIKEKGGAFIGVMEKISPLEILIINIMILFFICVLIGSIFLLSFLFIKKSSLAFLTCMFIAIINFITVSSKLKIIKNLNMYNLLPQIENLKKVDLKIVPYNLIYFLIILINKSVKYFYFNKELSGIRFYI